jgi:GT2 family glycosyltransferase
MTGERVDVSVVIVSFNTRALLRDCIDTVKAQEGVAFEIIVVDNNSRDGSPEMVAAEYPEVRLIASKVNLGFGAANNAAFAVAGGRYVALLNSDAFFPPGLLVEAVRGMEAEPNVGLAGAMLIGRDGELQPSSRLFPSVLNDALCMTGLSSRYPKSRFFGRADRTWCDPLEAADVDWVPGAFSILPREVLQRVGFFDERFFLYYEEVDLCRRIKAAGSRIVYWPRLRIVHIGGESSRTVGRLSMSSSGGQLTLWRMRSALLYYRKHHPLQAPLALWAETLWHRLRLLRNRRRRGADAPSKCEESMAIIELFDRAWKETQGGRVCPARPW